MARTMIIMITIAMAEGACGRIYKGDDEDHSYDGDGNNDNGP